MLQITYVGYSRSLFVLKRKGDCDETQSPGIDTKDFKFLRSLDLSSTNRNPSPIKIQTLISVKLIKLLNSPIFPFNILAHCLKVSGTPDRQTLIFS